MASLNLLRYLVIKDNENDNQVSEFFKKETDYSKCIKNVLDFHINIYLSQYFILSSYKGWKKCQQSS